MKKRATTFLKLLHYTFVNILLNICFKVNYNGLKWLLLKEINNATPIYVELHILLIHIFRRDAISERYIKSKFGNNLLQNTFCDLDSKGNIYFVTFLLILIY